MRTQLRTIGIVALASVLTLTAQAQVIRQVEKKDLILEIDLNVRAKHVQDPNFKKQSVKVSQQFTFDSAAFVFPAVRKTASSTAELSGVLLLNDHETDAKMELLPEQYPCGATLARWKATDWTGQEVGLKLKLQAQCFSTEMDEAAAMQLKWPANWTKALQSCFEPQMFIDVGPEEAYDMKPVKDLAKRWMHGKDPKSQPPVLVAKVLAGEVARFFQVNGSGLMSGRTGEIQGLAVQGAAEAAKKGRGSPFDAVALMTAIYREVGLPARMIIGWDTGRSDEADDDGFLKTKKGRGKEELHAWVEVGLLDDGGTEIWIPIDVLKLRKAGSKLPPFDKPWPFVGNHAELDGIIPFAFHYFPPTTVRSYGSPGFWGWLVMPKPPEQAEQTLRFNDSTVAMTPELQKKQREENEKKSRERR